MIQLIYSPSWFYGKDIMIDVLAMLVLALVSVAGYRYYKVSKHGKILLLVLSFSLLALAFLAKIMMNFTIYNFYNSEIDTRTQGYCNITTEQLISSDNLFFLGFLLYRVFTLLGFYLLFLAYTKQELGSTVLTMSLLALSSYFTESAYYVFHITALLILLAMLYTYFPKRTTLVLTSYILMTLSQVCFIFIYKDRLFYVAAEIIQLFGYLLMLFAFLRVKHAKTHKA